MDWTIEDGNASRQGIRAGAVELAYVVVLGGPNASPEVPILPGLAIPEKRRVSAILLGF